MFYSFQIINISHFIVIPIFNVFSASENYNIFKFKFPNIYSSYIELELSFHINFVCDL